MSLISLTDVRKNFKSREGRSFDAAGHGGEVPETLLFELGVTNV
jgi:hypothetical protein